MARRIVKLDARTINKIAAGEVVERPSSIVKELVENSLDAGASIIKVEVRRAGVELIMVSDDGSGMAREDMVLAFEKHTTSKLGCIEDLDSLATLGFRGEALASVGAVSTVTLSSKEVDSPPDQPGVELIVVDGVIGAPRSLGRPTGTDIEVRDLFGSVPARKKYMKAIRTELAHITDVMSRMILGNPNISFELVSDGKLVFRAHAGRDDLDGLEIVLGHDIVGKLVRVDHSSMGVDISGHLSKPELARKDTQGISVFVNGRYVRSPLVNQALASAYKGLLMKGRHPLALLHMTIEPRLVDVNIHPTKVEVRFAEENVVFLAVEEAAKAALASTSLVPEPSISGTQTSLDRQAEEIQGLGPVKIPAQAFLDENTPNGKGVDRKDHDGKDRDLSGSACAPMPGDRSIGGSDLAENCIHQEGIQPLGQVLDTYIVAKGPEGLVLIDQHAASERVHFERFMLALKEKRAISQTLVEPMLRDMGPGMAAVLEANLDFLADMGYQIEHFGEDSFRISAVPVIAGKATREELVGDILNELVEMGKSTLLADELEEAVHTLACHGSIRAGDKLTLSQMSTLLEELNMCKNPYTCPHGRPTVMRLSRRELEKLFGRTG